MFGDKGIADRYPGNTQSCLIVNVFCVYPMYILGIAFPQFYPLGIMLAYFGMTQILVHGIVINRKFKTIYNRGMATIVFLFFPLGIYYLYYLIVNFNLPTWNYWVPAIALPLVALLTIMVPIQICKDKNTKYVFPARDINGFSIRNKVARRR